MLKSYLPSRYNTWAFIYIVISLLFGFYKFAIVIFILHSLLYLLLRKNRNDFRDDPVSTKGMIFSPANGKILHVEKGVSHGIFGSNLIEIQIMIPWWKEMGIYMPLSAEIKNMMVHKGRSFFRYFKAFEKVGANTGKGVSLHLDNHGESVGFTFYKCRLGLLPSLVVLPGDRGGRRVNLGYFPLGGTVVLYLPENYEILIHANDEIIAGETILAARPI
jgi:hypothetical protein